jgi:HSP20 family protein
MSWMIPWRRRGSDLHPIAAVQEEVGRALENLMHGDLDFGNLFRAGWAPALDMEETDDAIIVKADVPGVDPKDLDIRVTGDVLTIKGEKRTEEEEKTRERHRVERSYGAFSRSVTLPEVVDPDKIQAEVKSGVLTVTMPKKAEAKARKIQIDVK